MTVHLRWKRSDRSVASDWRALILVGGGYDHLAIDKEGIPTARWLAERGVDSAIASYRVDPHRYPAPLDDARWALDQVRRSAPGGRVLVWGYSAGGHLAGMLAADPLARVDLLVLSYPVVSLRASDGHAGSARRLLGPDASGELRDALSLDRLLGAGSAPTVIAHGSADHVVAPQVSRLLHDHLLSVGVASRLQIVPDVGHGVGLLPSAPPDGWLEALAEQLVDTRPDSP